MKLNIIKQTDSLFKEYGIALDITIETWKLWYDEVMRREKLSRVSGDYSGIYDVDECGECGMVSEEHANDIIKFILNNEIQCI